MAFRLRSDGQKKIGEATFVAKPSFSSGLLPTKKEVLEVMIFHLLPSVGRHQMSKAEAGGLVGGGLMEHWVFQNIYTIQKVQAKYFVSFSFFYSGSSYEEDS